MIPSSRSSLTFMFSKKLFFLFFIFFSSFKNFLVLKVFCTQRTIDQFAKTIVNVCKRGSSFVEWEESHWEIQNVFWINYSDRFDQTKASWWFSVFTINNKIVFYSMYVAFDISDESIRFSIVNVFFGYSQDVLLNKD